LNVTNCNEELNLKFHVVPADFPITKDGILGRDFLIKNKADVNYKNEELSVENMKWKLLPQSKEFISIPSRSEIFSKVYCNIDSGEGIVDNHVLFPNVIIGSCITKSENSKCIVAIINTTNQDIVCELPTCTL